MSKMRLLNVWWDYAGENKRAFKSTTERYNYFSNKGLLSRPFNFNPNNWVSCSVKASASMFNQLIIDFKKYNYIVIYDDFGVIQKCYFAECINDNGRVAEYRLTEDTIATFLPELNSRGTNIFCKLNRCTFDDDVIEDPDDNTKVIFNRKATRLSAGSDNIMTNKYCVQRIELPVMQLADKTQSFYNALLEEFIDCWCYVYIAPKEKYNIFDYSGQRYESLTGFHVKIDGVYQGYKCFAFPIFKKQSRSGTRIGGIIYDIKKSDGNTYQTFCDELHNPLNYFKTNNSAADIYSIKYSKRPPWGTELPFNNQVILAHGDYNNKYYLWWHDEATWAHTDRPVGASYVVLTGPNTMCFGGTEQNRNECFYTPFFERGSFNDVIDKNAYINGYAGDVYYIYPQAASNETRTLRIRLFDGSYSDFDIDKIPVTDLRFKYFESITPYTSKVYVTLDLPEEFGVEYFYNNIVDKNFTGLISTVDNTSSFAVNQYDSFIANNKNFMLQHYSNLAYDTTTSLISSPNKANAIKTLGSAGMNELNYQLNIDNMKNAPDSLRNAGGDVNFSRILNGLALTIEIWASDFKSIREVVNHYKYYGTPFNQEYNLKNVLFKHFYFDYISASNINYTDFEISEQEREELNNTLSGVRLCYTDNMTTTLLYSNYATKFLQN